MTDTVVKLASRMNPVSRIVLKKPLWSAGTDSINRYLEHMTAAHVDPRQIIIPMLCMASANDPAETVRQTHQTYDLLPNPVKAKVIFIKETGADAHCQVNNPELAYTTLFDWLDATLDYRYQTLC